MPQPLSALAVYPTAYSMHRLYSGMSCVAGMSMSHRVMAVVPVAPPLPPPDPPAPPDPDEPPLPAPPSAPVDVVPPPQPAARPQSSKHEHRRCHRSHREPPFLGAIPSTGHVSGVCRFGRRADPNRARCRTVSPCRRTCCAPWRERAPPGAGCRRCAEAPTRAPPVRSRRSCDPRAGARRRPRRPAAARSPPPRPGAAASLRCLAEAERRGRAELEVGLADVVAREDGGPPHDVAQLAHVAVPARRAQRRQARRRRAAAAPPRARSRARSAARAAARRRGAARSGGSARWRPARR